MKKTEQALSLILQAIRLCDDFALSEAKSHLNIAVNKIKIVEKKRKTRENNLKIEELRSKNKFKINYSEPVPELDTNIEDRKSKN